VQKNASKGKSSVSSKSDFLGGADLLQQSRHGGQKYPPTESGIRNRVWSLVYQKSMAEANSSRVVNGPYVTVEDEAKVKTHVR